MTSSNGVRQHITATTITNITHAFNLTPTSLRDSRGQLAVTLKFSTPRLQMTHSQQFHTKSPITTSEAVTHRNEIE